MMSSAVNGAPSDHFMPSRRWDVYSRVSSLTSQLSAIFGSTPEKSGFQIARFSQPAMNQTPPQPGFVPTKPKRSVPPYSPGSTSGSTTAGFNGIRWSIGGSASAATRSASMGASVYVMSCASDSGTTEIRSANNNKINGKR